MNGWERVRGLFGKTTSTGTRGERQAERFLRRQKGYRVLARNWRSPRDRRDELDLVCRDRDVLVFVEVKTRSASALVPGYFAVDERKKDVIRRAADVYLKCLPSETRPRNFRFDVVEISMQPGATEGELRHFENVPLFSKDFWR
ncbi:endonuclease [Opitutaceae bacterium EW11]|nr:endonuclease [Opitutaceae bacterium EW11]